MNSTRTFLFVSIVVISTLLTINKNCYGQESTKSLLSFELGGDLVSRYIWRGCEQDFTASSSHIQPYGSFGINLSDQSSFSFGIWGSYGLTGGYSENDFSLSYNLNSPLGLFVAGLTDYYFPYLSIPFSNFDSDTSGAHTLETSLSFTGTESLPFRILISQNIHGTDAGSHSFYIEAGFFTSLNDVDLDFFIGLGKGSSSWHRITSEKFELINVGLNAQKNVRITQDFSIPIGISFVMNPYIKTTYLIFKISI